MIDTKKKKKVLDLSLQGRWGLKNEPGTKSVDTAVEDIKIRFRPDGGPQVVASPPKKRFKDGSIDIGQYMTRGLL